MTTYRKLHGKAVKTVTTNPTDDAAEGQIWFNSTDNKFRSVVNLEAWSSGSPMINASRQRYATGTQTAGLLFGGYKNPNTNIGSTEEYNGSGYSAGGTMSTARRSPGGAGVQTSSLAIGGYTSTAVTTVEEYNGSSWTSSPALNNAKFIAGSFGTSSACVTEGGAPAPKLLKLGMIVLGQQDLDQLDLQTPMVQEQLEHQRQVCLQEAIQHHLQII